MSGLSSFFMYTARAALICSTLASKLEDFDDFETLESDFRWIGKYTLFLATTFRVGVSGLKLTESGSGFGVHRTIVKTGSFYFSTFSGSCSSFTACCSSTCLSVSMTACEFSRDGLMDTILDSSPSSNATTSLGSSLLSTLCFDSSCFTLVPCKPGFLIWLKVKVSLWDRAVSGLLRVGVFSAYKTTSLLLSSLFNTLLRGVSFGCLSVLAPILLFSWVLGLADS